jgi:hypothetical protein
VLTQQTRTQPEARLIQARRDTTSWSFDDGCQLATFVRSVSDGVQVPFGVPRAWPAPPPAAQTRPAPVAPFLVVALALVGLAAITLLVLGLLDVHAITRHFSIH